MSEPMPHRDETLSLSAERRVDAVCVQFERALQAGQPARIEDYLRDTPEPERSALLRELLRLEVYYRIRCGESPTVDVQTPRQTQVLAREILADMPLERTATGIASTLVPAMNAGLSAYGAGSGAETGRLQVDGVGVGSGTSGTSQYRPDTILANEMVSRAARTSSGSWGRPGSSAVSCLAWMKAPIGRRGFGSGTRYDWARAPASPSSQSAGIS